ncbi:MAG: LysR family transcriptional regulator [Curtobacterium sp.]
MIDPRRLQLLAQLERLGTVAAVADELHLTPSGVSMQLAALEREAGVPITERAGRRLRLTPAGNVLARHGRELAATLTMAEFELDSIRSGTAGRYRIAVFPTAAQSIVAPLARALLTEGSALHLDIDVLEPDDAIAALVSGAADLAVVHGYTNLPVRSTPRLQAAPLGSEPVLLATNEPTSGSLADVAEQPFVAAPEGLSCARMVTTACRAAGFEPQVVVRTVDYAVQLALVAAGVGVALVPRMAAAPTPDDVHVRPVDPPIRRALSVVTRAGRDRDAGLRVLVERTTAIARSVLNTEVRPGTHSTVTVVD